jgi:hypothetical protein
MALFGCAPKRPLDYLGSAGLLWAISLGDRALAKLAVPRRDRPSAPTSLGSGTSPPALSGTPRHQTCGRLLELHRDWAVIDVPVHGSQHTFYRRNVDPAKMTLPWTKQTSSSQPAASYCLPLARDHTNVGLQFTPITAGKCDRRNSARWPIFAQQRPAIAVSLLQVAFAR